MELLLKRNVFTDQSTIGELSIDGKFECYILEDKDRGLVNTMDAKVIESLKIYGRTCIPYGRYQIILTLSQRFKRILPLLTVVKGYEGIRIHPGNTNEDTLGCLLPGLIKKKNKVEESTIAFNRLYAKLEEANKRSESIFITISK